MRIRIIQSALVWSRVHCTLCRPRPQAGLNKEISPRLRGIRGLKRLMARGQLL